MTPAYKQLLKVWIAAGLWTVLIAIESSDFLSAAHTSRILYPLLHFLLSLDPERFEVWHYYIRKTGHFVGYFILSALMFRAWKATLPSLSSWTARWATIAFLVSAGVASLDEWHQSFLPSRTGVFSDVVLDSTAALVAQIVIFLYWRRRSPDGGIRGYVVR